VRNNEGGSPYALCNVDSLINKLTNNFICVCNLFIARGLETKAKYLKGGW